MATPAQAAAATVGAGSLAAAGAYGITQAVSGGEETTEEAEEQTTEDSNEMPTEVDTFLATEPFTNEPYNTKLITLIKTTNLPYLVKPDNNEKWWKWAYENKFSKNKQGKGLDALFTSVDDSEKLKEACKNAYKSETSKYSFEQDQHLLQNISDYCTKGKTTFDISEPKADVWNAAQTSSQDYKHGVLSIQSNAAVLVKKDKGTNNDLWWKWAYKKLYLTTTENIDNLFAKTTAVTTGYHESTTTALNHVCDAAYKKDYSALKAETNKLLKNIKQFCSTDRTETELKLPEPKLEDGNLLSKSDSSYTSHDLVKENDKVLVDPKKAEDWWNWVFENVYSIVKTSQTPALTAPFNTATITKGFETISGDVSGNATSLNKACHEAYKKEKGGLGELNNETSVIGQVKKFCVPSTKTTNLKKPT